MDPTTLVTSVSTNQLRKAAQAIYQEFINVTAIIIVKVITINIIIIVIIIKVFISITNGTIVVITFQIIIIIVKFSLTT